MKEQALVQQSSRPLAVDLSLIILLVSFAVSFIPQLVHADWTVFLVYVKFGIHLLVLAIPLWFVARGKNWARWLLVAYAVAGISFALPHIIRTYQAQSVPIIVTFCLRNLIVLGALVALFLPSSSKWFRSNTDAVAPLRTD